MLGERGEIHKALHVTPPYTSLGRTKKNLMLENTLDFGMGGGGDHDPPPLFFGQSQSIHYTSINHYTSIHNPSTTLLCAPCFSPQSPQGFCLYMLVFVERNQRPKCIGIIYQHRLIMQTLNKHINCL